jgi:hypothetical protein
MKTDLFEANSKELFCPLDGLMLTESKWEWCGNQLLTCSKGHVWEASWSNIWEHQLEFDVIEMVNCPECGQLCPKRLMKHSEFKPVPETPQVRRTPSSGRRREGKRVCPDCFAKIQQAWKPDLKQSYGRLTISPIRRDGKVRFEYEQEVKIRPYPNPYMAGGYWGMGAVETEAEVEQLIEEFTAGDHWFDKRWKELGVKFEAIRKPEMTPAEYVNERDREFVEKHPEEADKHAQMQLIA